MTETTRPVSKPSRGVVLRLLGPGLVTGAADDDPSGIATYSQAGAQFGYGLLWTVFLTIPFMVAIQLVSALIGRVTGKGLAANIRKVFPRPVLLLLVGLLMVANTINIAADIAAMGEALQMIAGGGEHFHAVIFGFTSLVLQIFMPYERYVRFLKWLTLALLSYVATKMPPAAPNSLPSQTYADIGAYLLQQNGEHTGTNELAAGVIAAGAARRAEADAFRGSDHVGLADVPLTLRVHRPNRAGLHDQLRERLEFGQVAAVFHRVEDQIGSILWHAGSERRHARREFVEKIRIVDAHDRDWLASLKSDNPLAHLRNPARNLMP